MKTNEVPIRLQWLGGKVPKASVGVTWGVPWTEGEMPRGETFTLISPSGRDIPVQSWATAYWPDGSVKWSAHAAVVPQDETGTGTYLLRRSAAPQVGAAPEIVVREQEDSVTVDTGAIRCTLNRSGTSIIRSIRRGERESVTDGKLVCLREQSTESMSCRVTKEERFVGETLRVFVEQTGPVRAVVRIEGWHRSEHGESSFLPFTLRLYFFAGEQSFRAVHTFVYEGDPHQDFIKGLGLQFTVPTEGPLYHRHVRFAGDSGLFRESPKTLMTFRTKGKYRELFERQLEGESVTFDPAEDERFLELLDDSAVWDSFKLVQDSADHYSIWKRTKEGCSWLKAAEGRRSGGMMYFGGERGGLALGCRNFWRKHPSALEMHGASKDAAVLTAWFWSPDVRAMDLRHYDTETHLISSYEGFEELRSTPHGIANTSEMTVWCTDRMPNSDTLLSMVELADRPPLLVCEPGYYHRARAFGYWSLPDRSTPAKAWIEDQLDAVIAFYKEEIELRKWYGFWDYGDVMHSYDPSRHEWRYDIGGCAWQNTELAPNIWLWYMFLRSGREDIFRLAEAMTRHTSEVDVYHLGEYAGLGSRHNVIHWGCGCKEARISMAGLHRYYYYLTGDERLGDILDEVKDSDYAAGDLDPMRSYLAKDEYPTHVRIGPDWAAFASNWLTRWERFEDTAYRDKLLVGIDSLKRLPFRMNTGPVMGYDPNTGELHHLSDDNWGRTLMICMGGPQTWLELSLMLKDPEWEDMIAEVGEFYNLTKEEKLERTGGAIGNKGNWSYPYFSCGLVAYAAKRMERRDLAQLAWQILLSSGLGDAPLSAMESAVNERDYVRPIAREIPEISTNAASQWSINAMMCLEFIGDQLPETLERARGQV
ncbi:hypothetical protein [Paenibacillus sp.]|uniref:exo-rhamnogalacturonan lyase family protein n=1 Tax=Paenibacillus sp. TaxID=58172 RepID=UPI002D670FE6|nr:hypothetical protein [Paenibacillus sp.]HZG84008.1 hypothetical protein [Paenibacillus sp.]